MSKTALSLIIASLVVMVVHQQIVVRNYEALNQRLQDALSACAGIKGP